MLTIINTEDEAVPRPKLPAGKKRSRRVFATLTPSEYERLMYLHEVTQKTTSSLLRDALLASPDFKATDRRRSR